jgi:hypothetical protein
VATKTACLREGGQDGQDGHKKVGHLENFILRQELRVIHEGFLDAFRRKVIKMLKMLMFTLIMLTYSSESRRLRAVAGDPRSRARLVEQRPRGRRSGLSRRRTLEYDAFVHS